MDREIYASDKEYFLYRISEDDRESYVELHRQINGESTLFLNPHCKDMMWDQALNGKDILIYSIYD